MRETTSDADRIRSNKLLIELDKKRALDTTPRYSYEESLGGLCVELFDPQGESIAFMQGDDATLFLEDIAGIESRFEPGDAFKTLDDVYDYYISQYNCT